jgi:hypothetical protein
MSNKQPACVFVALGIQYAMCSRHIIICSQPHPAKFFHIISQTARFSKKEKKKLITCNACFEFLCKFRLIYFSFKEELSKTWWKTYIGLHVKYSLFLSAFNVSWIFSTDFQKKSSNTKFYENPFSWSRVVPYRRTDMKKLIVAFRNFANALKNWPIIALLKRHWTRDTENNLWINNL